MADFFVRIYSSSISINGKTAKQQWFEIRVYLLIGELLVRADESQLPKGLVLGCQILTLQPITLK